MIHKILTTEYFEQITFSLNGASTAMSLWQETASNVKHETDKESDIPIIESVQYILCEWRWSLIVVIPDSNMTIPVIRSLAAREINHKNLAFLTLEWTHVMIRMAKFGRIVKQPKLINPIIKM